MAQFGFDPEPAAKPLDDPFAGRQTMTGAGDVRTVESFERDKYLVLILSFDADPAVAYREHTEIPHLLNRNVNSWQRDG